MIFHQHYKNNFSYIEWYKPDVTVYSHKKSDGDNDENESQMNY